MFDWSEHLSTLEGSRLKAMEFLRDHLPESDLDCYPVSLFQEAADHALALREKAPWCAALDEEIFLHYVLCPRVNDEDLSMHRAVFFANLRSRIFGRSLEEKILEVNRWCHEQAVYQAQDDRTAAPLTVYRCGSGRCGEESAFLVAALRSVGIAARQIYAPRWSHCDDNHAWVEALCGETWYFLGACEPEPILNRGWFNTAASRGMLLRSRIFGRGNSPLHGELIGTEGDVTYYNQTARYAKTAPYVFRATKDGKPAAGAQFHLQVLNEASFHTIATLTAGEDGTARAALGIGDLYVVADLEGAVAADFCVDGQVDLALSVPTAEDTDWLPFVFHAPQDSPVNPAPLSADQKRARMTTLQRGDVRRAAKCGSCFDAARAAALPDCTELLQEARGNFETIYTFLRCSDDPLRAALLRTLARKDLRDVDDETLEAHLRRAAPYADQFPAEIFTRYVLCPRIALEKLTPWRVRLTDLCTAREQATYLRDPRALWQMLRTRMQAEEGRGYANLRWTPQAAVQAGRCDDMSLRILYVALLRTAGVPARLRPQDGAPEFWQDGAFHAAVPETCGTLCLTRTAEQSPRYRQNWTLSRAVDGAWQLLTLPDDWNGESYQCTLPAGQYRLMTSVRLPNGNQFAAYRDMTIRAGETVTVPLYLRDFALEDLLGRQEMPPIPAETLDGAPVLDAARQDGRPRLLFWLEEGREPTEHVLNELSEGRAALEQLDIGITFFLRGRESLAQPTLAALLATWEKPQLLLDDWAFDLDAVARHLSCDPERPPLAVLCSGTGQAVYAVSGYHVGSVALLTRIAAHLGKNS